MTQRVLINTSGTFRVSVAGVDVNSAQFDNLLFDSNQPPLRCTQNGWGAVTNIPQAAYTAASPQTIAETHITLATTAAPAGTTPVFMCTIRMPFSGNAGDYTTPSKWDTTIGNVNSASGTKGAGIAICSGDIIGVSFTPDGSGAVPQAIVSYAFFKNFT